MRTSIETITGRRVIAQPNVHEIPTEKLGAPFVGEVVILRKLAGQRGTKTAIDKSGLHWLGSSLEKSSN